MKETNNDYWVEGDLYKYLGHGRWQYIPKEQSASFDASKANMFDGTYDDSNFFDRKNKMVAEIIGGDTAKADAGKPRLSLVPRKIIWDIAKIREYGNKKYGSADNWKKVEPGRYRDAAYRHFMRYLDDPTGLDEESGLPHLWHLACNISFLCEMEEFDV